MVPYTHPRSPLDRARGRVTAWQQWPSNDRHLALPLFETRYVQCVAGFRNGRGRNPRPPQQQPGGGQYGGQQGPHPYPGGGGSPYPGGPGAPGGQQWPPPRPSDEPEYFGQNAGHAGGHGSPNDDPGHTRAFTLGEDPGGYGPDGYGQGGYGPDGYGPDPNVATYRAGQTTGPPAGPRLPWKQLLSGIVLRPQQTFWQMRDYQVWAPALTVTFVFGLFFAIFGFEESREQLLDAAMSTSVPQVLVGGIAVTISMLMLGAVTNALARQFGGDGAWAPTVGLAMLISSMTEAPRVLFGAFLHMDHGLVQIIGWVTLALAGALLTSMISKSHDLPWPRALGACSIQLLALLALHLIPTLGS